MAANLRNIYFLKYSNYFNRRVPKPSLLFDDYSSYVLGGAAQNINFNPNDGVSTTLVVNRAENTIGDYLLVTYQGGTLGNITLISSRWFIVDSVRNRGNQYTLKLKRDLIADYYDAVVSSPVFVERGTLEKTDPMILNSEGMTFNQIKTSEILLKDETKGAWIVGYVPKDSFSTEDPVDITAGTTIAGSQSFTATNGIENFEYNGIKLWDYTSEGTKAMRSYVPPSSLVINVYSYVQHKTYSESSSAYQAGTLKMPYSSAGAESDNWQGTDGIMFDLAADPVYEDEQLSPGTQAVSVRYPNDNEWGRVSAYNWGYGSFFHVGNGSFIDSIYEAMVASGMLTDETIFNDLLFLKDKIIYDSVSGEYYKITIETSNTYYSTDRYVGFFEYGSSSWNACFDEFSAMAASAIGADLAQLTDPGSVGNASKAFSYRFKETVVEYKIRFTSQPNVAKVTIDSNRYTLDDSPYDMFCLPYSREISLKVANQTTDSEGFVTAEKLVSGDPELARAVGVGIATAAGSGTIYDVQLLPYCPARYIIQSDGTLSCAGANFDPITTTGYDIYLTQTIYNEDGTVQETTKTHRQGILASGASIPTPPEDSLGYAYDSEGNRYLYSRDHTEYGTAVVDVTIGAMLWCRSSNFDFTIDLETPIEVGDPKIESQVDVYRLVSPNYNGTFEFNVAKNGGLRYFSVYCTYKPFNPYISVKPNFSLLYGQDFEDARGLICGGDFSMAQVTDAWADYEMANKNYQAVFDRQIQNMETSNQVSRINEVVGAVGNTVSGAASNAVLGGLAGGPVGAAVAGASSFVAGAVGGLADYSLNERMRRENLDYARDRFNYQLGNIKAMPQSLSKSSAFTANNKVFPMLEYYTCTDKERKALEDKIKYDGMAVGRIGSLNEFSSGDGDSYVRGSLIRLETSDPTVDAHIANEIADEISRGVYL